MSDLIARLRKLAPPNPVARICLTEDDWEEIERILVDAERWKWANKIEPEMIVTEEPK